MNMRAIPEYADNIGLQNDPKTVKPHSSPLPPSFDKARVGRASNITYRQGSDLLHDSKHVGVKSRIQDLGGGCSTSVTPLIVAVVATHNRPQLLANRSLKSIAGQTRPPDMLIVVDDSDPENLRCNRTTVDEFKAHGIKTVYMENRRTPGAAGAWNTALAHLQVTAPSTFVAILDDDDTWAPEYLRQCEKAALARDLDMVASGIVYHKSVVREGRLLDPPDRLVTSDMLVRNTHIQGSNMFVKLRKLLEAGGFDEALASTTDRDVCIRLADLGTVRYGALSVHLVHHYAENDRPRLSTTGSDVKRAGLRYFFRKYGGRMSDAEKLTFIQRSRRLFDCEPLRGSQHPPAAQALDFGSVEGHLDLVVGAITSPDAALVTNLMDSLVSRLGGRGDVTLRLVLLENGGHEAAARDALREAVDQASRRGLDVVLKTLEQQAADAATGIFEVATEEVSRQKSIAMSRTMLQHYLYMEASPREAAVVWILDDDLSLDVLEYGPCGPASVRDVDYVSGILHLRKTGASVVLCQETGDSPVPAPSCIRTQLVDLYHNLHRIAGLRPNDPYPDLRDENRMFRLARRDYYYDLSSTETDHLELPFWYEAGGGKRRAVQAFNEMVSRLPDMLRGVQTFRPLTRSESDGHATSVAPSINRGPATLVFDVRALRDFPNAVPAVGGIDVRRSDMVWSLLNHFVAEREIVQSQLPVRHVRKTAAEAHPGFESLLRDIIGHAPNPGRDGPEMCAPSKMLQDIRGHALYSSLRDVFANRSQPRRQEGMKPNSMKLLHFNEQEVRSAVESYRKHIRERAHAFELNFIRIMGLLSALRPLCKPSTASEPEPWWLKLPECSTSATELRKFVESLESVYTDALLDEFMRQAMDIDTGAIGRFLRDLSRNTDLHRAGTPLPADALRRNANTCIRSEFSTGPLTYLGMGDEGVVLTDGRLVYKYFHYWNPQDRESRIAFLQSLTGKLSGYRTLPPLLEVRRKNGHVVAVYPYEPSTKYDGGHLDGILSLLRECRQAGIACRNIHPDNIRVTSSGLRFIDYGADIVPINDLEFEQMCRRAFLTYRFARRSNLKRLMTRALSDTTLAELTGLDQFRNSLDPRGLDTLYYHPMARLVADRHPRSVLDYGCGGSRLSEQLARAETKIVQYDPDPAIIKKCTDRGGNNVCGGTELRARLLADLARFDAVVCGRVLCTVTDGSEFEDVLQDLRRFVADSGTVFVSVCNPFYLTSASTELAEKHLPSGFRYGDTFSYDKTLALTCKRRVEVHRGYDTYRRAFAKVGLSVRDVCELDGTDTRSILPASEHLVFQLSPDPSGGPRVSLLIKTCLMEWRTIERLVRHQVDQLESPLSFVEKVVVVDPSEGPFQRQYDHSDPEAHRDAMERLLRDGVVDRVVYVPTDSKSVRSTYRRWFGAESVKTHSVNGQQLLASLFGFDSCAGDYVLQMDSDLMIARIDRDHDYLSEMADVLRLDPKALFVSMNICKAEAAPYTAEGPDGDWRVDVRGCLYDRRRLLSVLPISNKLENGRFVLAWHRAFDRLIASSAYRTYRGGNPKTAAIHVPNYRKTESDEWMDILGAVERGYVPEAQLGKVELAGSVRDWSGPRRSEPFVFVICGRNVQHGRFKRCLQSLVSQQGVGWGAVVVDDASTNGFGDYARILLTDYADRVTLIRNERQRGSLYNTWNAVARVCVDPETVVITLDADDALIGRHVLERVQAEYDDGADATVGSMLRLDKEATYRANFDNPRRWDSNVWQHLRTFKKRLFDAIAVEDFKIDGEWINLAADWAFMVPIIEMASSPRFIPDLLYLYEPASPKNEAVRRERDRIIGNILSKTPYAKLK